MKIEIPTIFMGKPIEGAMERVLAGAPKNESAPVEQNGNYEVPANEKRNYIQVPQFGIAIATRKTRLGKNMFDTLEALTGEKLKMPSVKQFMRHWINVKEASEGSRQLVYADGTPVGDDVSKDLWNYMSSTDRSKFGKPCWTWLNTFFREDKGKWYIETDLEVKDLTASGSQQKYLEGKREELRAPIRKTKYVALDFNDQGMPIQESSTSSYQQGQNVYFYNPVDCCVARFCAISDGAYLSCDRNPASSYPRSGYLQALPQDRAASRKIREVVHELTNN